MRRRNVATAIGFAGFALIVVALVGSLGAFVYGEMGAMRQRDALNLLNYFQQAMVTKLYDEVSPVDDLAAAFEVDPDDEAWFPRVAGELLEREEVSYVAYVRGDTMAYAYPEEEFGDTVGDDLASFSYVYTLAKWTDGFVVESSVELSSGENVFLFVRPVNVGGSYYGEAVVGVKESYVLEQLDFASLEEAGYLYELWSVSPQDGSKDVIAASGGSHDFSHAAKSTFNMPTQWTLSIMPEQGWIPREWSIFLAVGVIVVEALIFGLAFALLALRRARRFHAEAVRRDDETGLLAYRACGAVVGTGGPPFVSGKRERRDRRGDPGSARGCTRERGLLRDRHPRLRRSWFARRSHARSRAGVAVEGAHRRQEDVLRGSVGRRALPGGRRRSRRARRTYGVAAGARSARSVSGRRPSSSCALHGKKNGPRPEDETRFRARCFPSCRDYTMPWAIMASASFLKPAILAPMT